MYALVWSPRFSHSAQQFVKQHPDLRRKLAQTLIDLATDPFQPHLKCHPLSGKLMGMHVSRLTESYCITLTILVTEKEILLLDIGGHDEMYR